jgi:hypothetical protein
MWQEVRTWLQNEGKPVDELTYGGYGAILWLRLGRVILSLKYAAMPNAGYERLKKLEALTAGAFECH